MAGGHTFLFTDLVGFTALTAAEGDERGADVALEFCERVRPLLTGHGAEEVKTIGDALMLRCDDPAARHRSGSDRAPSSRRCRAFRRCGSACTPARPSRVTATGTGRP